MENKLIFGVVLIFVAHAAALQCWHCENARSNAECISKGYLEDCTEVNTFCAIEVRIENEIGRVTKRCKQDVACRNNEKHLRREFKQCVSRFYKQEEFCYCCYTTDNCNRNKIECMGPRPPPPTIAPICNPPVTFQYGNVDCTDSNNIGTACTFTCDEPGAHELIPPVNNVMQCDSNRQWNIRTPCCAKKCPPVGSDMDVTILMDASPITDGVTNFELGKELIKNILRSYKVGETQTRYAIFAYAGEVDESSQIQFDDYFEEEGLLAGVDAIPYEGSGRNTRNALLHARDEILRTNRGKRSGVPSVVVVLTNGKSTGNPARIARELAFTQQVIVILVKNLENEEENDEAEEQLNAFSENPDNFFIYESYEQLRREIQLPAGAPHRSFVDDYTGVTRSLFTRLKAVGCNRQRCRND